MKLEISLNVDQFMFNVASLQWLPFQIFYFCTFHSSGLDPAAPLFEGEAIGARLDKSDATFVDIIHTNTQKVAIVTGIGIKKEIGHLDFYVNGGGSQPGCFDLSDGIHFVLNSFALTIKFKKAEKFGKR